MSSSRQWGQSRVQQLYIPWLSRKHIIVFHQVECCVACWNSCGLCPHTCGFVCIVHYFIWAWIQISEQSATLVRSLVPFFPDHCSSLYTATSHRTTIISVDSLFFLLLLFFFCIHRLIYDHWWSMHFCHVQLVCKFGFRNASSFLSIGPYTHTEIYVIAVMFATDRTAGLQDAGNL